MKITRIIHPIGQGAFYTEKLSNGSNEINVVYDCGGFNRGQKKMERYLDCYLKQKNGKKNIEAVFISHFHADHMNGLQYLLENAKVNYLFLPQLTEEVVLEAFVYNYCISGTYSRANQLLLNLHRGDSMFGDQERPTKIIQIRESNDNRIPEDIYLEETTEEDDLTIRVFSPTHQEDLDDSTIIPSGTILHCGEWLYIPFNSRVSSDKIKSLKQSLEYNLGTSLTIENLPELVKGIGVDTCKKIYQDVFGKEHNSYSMTLFSGTTHPHHFENLHVMQCCNCDFLRPCSRFFQKLYKQCCNPNILYTGDFQPQNNVNDLVQFYNQLWDKIASIQMPHHGSRDNFDKTLYENPIRGIVSVGNDNPYHHPNIDTLTKIQEQGCHPVIVTEDKSSMKIYHYEYY